MTSDSNIKIDGTVGQDVFVGRSSNTGRHALIASVTLVGLVCLMFAGFHVRGFLIADDFFESAKVRTAAVTQGAFERSISVEGNVVATFSPTLYAQDVGVVSLHVVEGENVAKDQLLASIFNPELTSQLKRQQSVLELQRVELETLRIQLEQRDLEARQSLTLLKINLAAGKRELERMGKIVSKGSISINDYEKLKDTVHALEVQVDNTVQQNELKQKNHELEIRTKVLSIEQQTLLVNDLIRQVDELNVISPVDGVVGAIQVNERDTLVRNQPIMNVVDLSSYEVEVLIPETYAESLAAGLQAFITYRNREYQGRLTAISPEVKLGSVAARVVFDDEAPPGLRQNLRLNNRIILESKDNVMKIRRGPFVEAHGGRGVYVLDGEIATYRPIRIGSTGLNEVEIQSGVEPGELLIISNTAELMGAHTVLITD